jgi:aryl carrier-like protein
LKDLLAEIERWRREGEQIALATLVAGSVVGILT